MSTVADRATSLQPWGCGAFGLRALVVGDHPLRGWPASSTFIRSTGRCSSSGGRDLPLRREALTQHDPLQPVSICSGEQRSADAISPILSH
jgi:hypothetical protein